MELRLSKIILKSTQLHNLLQKVCKAISLIDVVNFFYLLFLLVLVNFSPTRNRTYYYSFGLYLLLLVGLSIIVRLRQKIKSPTLYFWIYFWYPVFYLLIIFQSFFWLLPAINQAVILENRCDAVLFTMDMRLVNVHPVLWFGEWVHPLLTDIMYIVYLLYFFLPFVLLISLFIQRKFRELQEAYFILGFAFYMAYFGYIFVPARGPRFYLNLKPHAGLFLANPIREIINFLEPNKYDAFPSVHQLITVLVFILIYRYERRYFYYLLPIAIGITISLFYCQYHYLIDVIVGTVLAILFFIMGKYLLEKTQGIFRDSMLIP